KYLRKNFGNRTSQFDVEQDEGEVQEGTEEHRVLVIDDFYLPLLHASAGRDPGDGSSALGENRRRRGTAGLDFWSAAKRSRQDSPRTQGFAAPAGGHAHHHPLRLLARRSV